MNNRTEAPSANLFIDTLRKSISLLKEERLKSRLGRINGVHILDVSQVRSLIVIGDIHGDYNSLAYILNDVNNVINNNEKALFVALGDYIDRGTPNGQVLSLFNLLKLKLNYPENVILLRGNHEPPQGLEPYPHDYPYALISLYGRNQGKEIYEVSRELFNELPYALVIRGLALLLHGGPPTFDLDKDEETYLGYNTWPPEINKLEEILWNDPSDFIEFSSPNPRGAGRLWGVRVTERVLEKLRIKMIIRGHEPAADGYKLNHEGRVLTLFSRLGQPYFNLKASYLLCQEDDLRFLAKRLSKCIKTFS